VEDSIQPCVHYFLRNFLFLVSISHTTCQNILRGVIIVKTLIQLDASQNKAEHTSQFEVTNTKDYTLLLLHKPSIWNRSVPLARAAYWLQMDHYFFPPYLSQVMTLSVITWVFYALAKLRKATISFVTYVCLSVRPSFHMKQMGSQLSDFHKILYLNVFRKFLEKIRVR
jgi:hypothetical protein